MSTPGNVIIAGAGMAGFSVASGLRELGYAGRIVMVGEERWQPYNRPPLSKGFLTGGGVQESNLALRAPAYYQDKRIEVLIGRRVVAVDRTHHRMALDDDTVHAYEHLVFATGARNRKLPVPGADLDGVFFLRTMDDAIALRARLASVKRIVVIGAGFIGLEVALVARKLGMEVTVVDIANRPMARVLSPAMSEVFVREHTKQGVRFLFETQIMRILGSDSVTAVEPIGGAAIPADLVVIGIGVQPNVEVAAAGGLDIGDGILVDEMLSASDPDISAVGDCASHPNQFAGGARIRLESVQNANDQGRCIAARLTGNPAAYSSVPWFWSDQGQLKLQIAGYTAGCDETVIRGDASGPACAAFCFRGARFVGVETINRPVDHMIGRKLLAHHVELTPQQASDERFDLKARAAHSTPIA